MAQFRQPDFSKGDPNTLGGYIAVHDRPAAFEGSDGFSYSVEILADEDHAASGDARWAGYLFFVKWARIGASTPEGHLESEVLASGATESEARERVGGMPLNDVKRALDRLIAQSSGGERPKRKWWDAMADADDETES